MKITLSDGDSDVALFVNDYYYRYKRPYLKMGFLLQISHTLWCLIDVPPAN